MSSPDRGLSPSVRGTISSSHLSTALQTRLQSCSSHPALGHILPPESFSQLSNSSYSFFGNASPHRFLVLVLLLPGVLVTFNSTDEWNSNTKDTRWGRDRRCITKCNLIQQRCLSWCNTKVLVKRVKGGQRSNRINIFNITTFSSVNDFCPYSRWRIPYRDDCWPETNGTCCKDFKPPQKIQEPSSQETDTWGQWEKYVPYTVQTLSVIIFAKYWFNGQCYFSYPILRFLPVVCPGVRESSQQVSQVRDSYSWVLSIPNKKLRMNFQEVNYHLRRRGWVQRALVKGNNWTILYILNFSFNLLFSLGFSWSELQEWPRTVWGAGQSSSRRTTFDLLQSCRSGEWVILPQCAKDNSSGTGGTQDLTLP